MRLFAPVALLIALALELPTLVAADAADAVIVSDNRPPKRVAAAAHIEQTKHVGTTARHVNQFAPSSLPPLSTLGSKTRAAINPSALRSAVSPGSDASIAGRDANKSKRSKPWLSIKTTRQHMRDKSSVSDDDVVIATDATGEKRAAVQAGHGAVVVSDRPSPPISPTSALLSIDTVPNAFPASFSESATCDTCSGATCDACSGGPKWSCASLFTTGGTPCDDLMRDVRSGSRVWAKSEYLYWWAKGDDLPPLVTTSANNVAEQQLGVLGLPTTTTLFGDETVNGGPRQGGRITLGFWFDDIQSEGIQADYLMLETESTRFDASSDGSFRLARPFVNAETLVQNSNIIAANGVTIERNGSITVEEKSQFESGGIAWRHLIWNDCEPSYWYRLNFLMGYRYFQLNEGVSINDTRVLKTFPNVTLSGFDSFDTTNRFHGGELGFTGEINSGRFSFGFTGKVAMGNMHQVLDIDGILAQNGLTVPGDLLSKPSNIGRTKRNNFAVVPEVTLDLGYRPTRRLKFAVGYSFIHLNRVFRPASSIDLGVDLNQTLARPAPKINTTDFYLHGLSASAELKF